MKGKSLTIEEATVIYSAYKVGMAVEFWVDMTRFELFPSYSEGNELKEWYFSINDQATVPLTDVVLHFPDYLSVKAVSTEIFFSLNKDPDKDLEHDWRLAP